MKFTQDDLIRIPFGVVLVYYGASSLWEIWVDFDHHATGLLPFVGGAIVAVPILLLGLFMSLEWRWRKDKKKTKRKKKPSQQSSKNNDSQKPND